MKLYVIIRSKDNISNKDTYELLLKAARDAGVDYEILESDNFDYVRGFDNLDYTSVMYRLARGNRAASLEVQLALRGMKGAFRDVNALLSRSFSWGSAMRMQAAGVPIIPTIYNVSKHESARLADYVDQLSGFPVIVKASGGSHGEGVMKVDSLNSLRSILGFVTDAGSSQFVLRQFIADARHIRLVVVGDKVVDVIEYDVQPDDFRTNAVAVPTVVDRNDIDASIKQIAVDAVTSLGLEFGGVDILIATDGKPYVAEVNFPCNYARNQLNTGADIARMLVDYLVGKVE